MQLQCGCSAVAVRLQCSCSAIAVQSQCSVSRHTLMACCCGSAKRTSRASAAPKSRRKAGRIDSVRQRVGSSAAADRIWNSAPALLGLTRPSSSSDATFSATLTHFAADRIAAMSLGAAAMSSSQLGDAAAGDAALDTISTPAADDVPLDDVDSTGAALDRRRYAVGSRQSGLLRTAC